MNGKTSIAVGLLTLSLLAGVKAADRLGMAVKVDTGQPIADGLPNPGSWVFLGTETIPGKMQTMTWTKPVGMQPRESKTLDQAAAAKVFALIGKPRETYSGEYSESFELQNLPRPRGTPAQYLEAFKQQQLQNCAGGNVVIIRADSELLLEAKSGGCERFGAQDEIDRFLFGRNVFYHMVYMVKAPDMTTEQHDAAIKAVTAWQ